MKTQFLNFEQMTSLESICNRGDKEAIAFAFKELWRLQAIISNYEGAISQLSIAFRADEVKKVPIPLIDLIAERQ